MKVAYWHPLNLTFRSAETIQVIRDYAALAKEGVKVTLFGFYDNTSDLDEIMHYANDSGFDLQARSRLHSRAWEKFVFGLRNTFGGRVIWVTRSHRKTIWPRILSSTMGDVWVHEAHEGAFPHVLEKSRERGRVKNDKYLFEKLMKQMDGLLLTNFSQLELLEKEFKCRPKSMVVLPNGVELSRFHKAAPHPDPDGFIWLVYTGGFNVWKNVELLFAALVKLPRRYRLRIAGGKGDKASQQYIQGLIHKYGVAGRVDYRGFVDQKRLVSEVIDGASALLLPLGDNVESRYLTSPMKLFEYMATRIPVVAVNYPTVTSIAGEEALWLANNNPDSFAAAILDATTSKSRQQKLLKMNELAEQYSYSVRAKRYKAWLEGLVEKGGSRIRGKNH